MHKQKPVLGKPLCVTGHCDYSPTNHSLTTSGISASGMIMLEETVWHVCCPEQLMELTSDMHSLLTVHTQARGS